MCLIKEEIITVVVNNTEKEKQEFLIKEDSTVDELIEMYQGTINFDNLQEKQNPQKKQLYVQYNGKQLKPDMTLKECGITNKSVVHILVRLQGGK